jgi:hypothetical protein
MKGNNNNTLPPIATVISTNPILQGESSNHNVLIGVPHPVNGFDNLPVAEAIAVNTQELPQKTEGPKFPSF